MSDYGLPSVRDKDGELQAVDHSYEWGGEEVTIQLLPPTISQQEEYENLGEDVDTERLHEILDDHLVKPEIDGDPTLRETMCYLEGVMDYSTGGTDLSAEVRDELERRQDGEGN